MAAPSKLQIVLFTLCSFTFLSLFIYMNIEFSMRKAVDPNKLTATLKQELQKMFDRYQRQMKENGNQENNVPLFTNGQSDLVDLLSTRSPSEVTDDIDNVPFLFKKNFTPKFVLGAGRSHPVSVVIGIPSVKRPGVQYLSNTLQSIFSSMYPVNEDDVAVVVFIAETDEKYIKSETQNLYAAFTQEVDSGLLQVISSPENFYPKFDKLRATLGDPLKRIHWRSKEVIDAAYLMFVCRHKANYYMMLEDDVLALKGYVSGIKNFAAKMVNKQYCYLSFAKFNSIGKLFRTSDVPVWVTYLLTFYGLKPIDWLMMNFVENNACHPEMNTVLCSVKKREAVPQSERGFFQHVGKQSSLVGKTQNIQDSTFDRQQSEPNPHRNPTAKVTTNYSASDGTSAASVYDDSGGMNQHFSISPSNIDDHLTVTFNEQSPVQKVLIKSGHGTSLQFCENCAGIEVAYDISDNYEHCAFADKHGSIECRPAREIRGFRIRNSRAISDSVWIGFIYVQVK